MKFLQMVMDWLVHPANERQIKNSSAVAGIDDRMQRGSSRQWPYNGIVDFIVDYVPFGLMVQRALGLVEPVDLVMVIINLLRAVAWEVKH